MRRFSLVMVACLLLSASVVAAAPVFGTPQAGEATPVRENCRIYYFRANDPDPPLNVRSSPELLADNIIATLPNGQLDFILSERGGWFKIALRQKATTQQVGWVKADRTEYGCNWFAEPVQSPAVMQGKFIGTGTHKYMIELQAGQTLILRPQYQIDYPHRSYWPSAVSGPGIGGHQAGVPHAYGNWWRKPGDTTSPEPLEWRWTSQTGGIYEVYYESNFKGFEYGPVILEVVDK